MSAIYLLLVFLITKVRRKFETAKSFMKKYKIKQGVMKVNCQNKHRFYTFFEYYLEMANFFCIFAFAIKHNRFTQLYKMLTLLTC